MTAKGKKDKALGKMGATWKGELQHLLNLRGKVSSRGRPKPVSNRTLANREQMLYNCLYQLKEMGYPLLSVHNLKEKHIGALVSRWDKEGLSAGSIANKLAALRALAKWIGKPGMVKPGRFYVDDPERLKRRVAAVKDKSWTAAGVDPMAMVAQVKAVDPYVAMQLEIIYAFGLRREEAVQFKPHRVDEGGVLRVRDGTKGGRERMIPVESDYQRDVLARAKLMAPRFNDHIGGPKRTLGQALNRFSYVMRSLGFTRDRLGVTAHGLRHQRLNDIYEEVAGVPSPVRQIEAGEKAIVRPADPMLEAKARQKVTAIAGHGRLSITTAYTGSARSVGEKAKARLNWGQTPERVVSVSQPGAPQVHHGHFPVGTYLSDGAAGTVLGSDRDGSKITMKRR